MCKSFLMVQSNICSMLNMLNMLSISYSSRIILCACKMLLLFKLCCMHYKRMMNYIATMEPCPNPLELENAILDGDEDSQVAVVQDGMLTQWALQHEMWRKHFQCSARYTSNDDHQQHVQGSCDSGNGDMQSSKKRKANIAFPESQ